MKSKFLILVLALAALTASPLKGVTVDNLLPRVYSNASGETMSYRLFVPAMAAGEKYPLVLFLHGAGEGGSDNRFQLVKWPAPLMLCDPKIQANNPCFLVAPQRPSAQTWNSFNVTPSASLRLAKEIVDSLVVQYPQLDTSRIYVTGLSEGAIAVFYSQVSFPGYFAAGVPIGGGISTLHAPNLTAFPIHGFVGGSDTSNKNSMQAIVNAMTEQGTLATLNVYPGSPHVCMNPGVFGEPDLLPYLFQFRQDNTAPTAPSGVAVEFVDGGSVALTWNTAQDSESGILLYRVFRDGQKIAEVLADTYGEAPLAKFVDRQVQAGEVHQYQVQAVNAGSVPSALSDALTLQIQESSARPKIIKVWGCGNKVRLVFDSRMDRATAVNSANYTLSDNVNVSGAALLESEREVELTVSGMQLCRTYSVTTLNVGKKFSPDLVVDPQSAVHQFTPVPDGIISWLRADSGMTLKNGEKLSRWADETGSGIDATQADSAKQPRISSDLLNGFPTVDLVGDLDHLMFNQGFSDFTKGFSAVFLVRSSNSQPDARLFEFGIAGAQGLSYPNGRGDRLHNVVFARDGGTAGLKYQVYDGTTLAGEVKSVSGFAENQWHILCVTQEGGAAGNLSNVEICADNIRVATGTAEVPRTTTRTNKYIGRMMPMEQSSEPGYFRGGVAEVMFFNKALSRQEQLEVSRYLRSKFLVPSGLNMAPLVDAEDVPATTQLSGQPASVLVRGHATDDGLPGPLLVEWSKESGPGAATFSHPNSLEGTATFDVPGDYVLRLTVSDGELSNFSLVPVTINVLDVSPPSLTSLSANGNAGQVFVRFSEPVEAVSAADVRNYTIDNHVAVNSAELLPDGDTVKLEVSPMMQGIVYTLHTTNVKDMSPDANTGPSSGTFTFSRLYLSETFSHSDLPGWTKVDEGTSDPASVWTVVNGEARESSNLSDLRDSANDRVGTFLAWLDQRSLLWKEYEFKVNLRSSDDDGIGVMFYYTDPNNYYRFEMDRQRNFRKLIQKVNGVVTLLASENAGYNQNQSYLLSVQSKGGQIQISLDGTMLFGGAVGSAAHSKGTVALYSWGNSGAYFDNVTVSFIGTELTANDLASLKLNGTVVGTTGGGYARTYSDGTFQLDATGSGFVATDPPAVDPLDGDFDGVNDDVEVAAGLSLANPDSDGDGISDGAEIAQSSDPLSPNPFSFSSLDFHDGFESMPLGSFPGGLNNWISSGSVSVSAAMAQEGFRSVSLLGAGGVSTIGNTFSAKSHRVVWSEFSVKPIATALNTQPSIAPGTAVAFYFVEGGKLLRIYDGVRAQWVTHPLPRTLNLGEWQRVTVRSDYDAQSWSLWINGNAAAQSIGFAHRCPYYSKFSVQNESEGTTLLDDVTVSASMPGSSLDLEDSGYLAGGRLIGNFRTSVHISSLSGGPGAMAGIVARERSGSGGRYVFLGIRPDQNLILSRRTQTGALGSTEAVGSLAFPDVWLRLERDSNLIRAYSSADGGQWTLVETIDVTGFPYDLDVGMFVSSGGGETPAAVRFSTYQPILGSPWLPDHGMYFTKSQYTPRALPDFAATRSQIPTPILDGNPEYVDLYWRSWELAYQHYRQPQAGSKMVSNYMDEAFNQNVFQWDTIFMVMFGRYNHSVFPAIESLDNFYNAQRENGFIARDFDEAVGTSSLECEDCVNPPLFAWAEWESFKLTGDEARLAKVLLPLEKYAEWLELNRVRPNTVHGLFWNTPFGSGMDNTPREGSGWVCMSAQMAMQYDSLANICDTLGETEKVTLYRNRADSIRQALNDWMWDEVDSFYFDIDNNAIFNVSKTVASFWPLAADAVSHKRTQALIQHLIDPDEFWRLVPFPSLSADEYFFDPNGSYWRGSVWAPTNYAAVKGLEIAGYEKLARLATEKYLFALEASRASTNTLWENYKSDSFAPGNNSRPDFVGWTGLGPIAQLFENVIGLRPDAASRLLTWHIGRMDRHGVQGYRLGTNVISVICEQRAQETDSASITVTNSEAFKLVVALNGREMRFELEPGTHSINTALFDLHPPTNVTGSLTGPESVLLNWSDANAGTAKHRVYRRSSLDPVWDEQAFQLLAELPAGVSTYTDNLGTLQAPAYYYVVKSARAGELSGPSDEVAVTTQAPEPRFVVTPSNTFDVQTSVTFDAGSSSSSVAPITAWTWNFGDGTSLGNGQVVSHVFADRGTHLVTLTATTASGISATVSQKVYVTDSAATIPALLVAGLPLNQAELAIKARLEGQNFSVTAIDDDVVQTSDGNGKGLVIISSSVASGSVNTKFRTAAVPILIYESLLFDDMGMTGPTDGTDYGKLSNQARVQILDANHSLAAGMSGTFKAFYQSSFMTWGRPNANGKIVAGLVNDASKATIFCYERGVGMVGLSSPERRVGFFLENDGAYLLNSEGLRLFDAAVSWLANRLPSVSLASTNSNPVAGQSVQFTAVANDSDGSVARVEFFVNNQSISILTSPPYTTTWTPNAVGTYTAKAIVTDNRGGTRESNSVTVVARTQYENWRATRFTSGQLLDATVSGAAADPDGDGLLNLVEYGLDGNPLVPEPALTPKLSQQSVLGADYLTLEYSRPIADRQLSYIVEVSDDLQRWFSGPIATQLLSSVDQGDKRIITVRDLTSLTNATKRFMRLRVLPVEQSKSYVQSFDTLSRTNGTDSTWTNNATLPIWFSTRTQYRAADGSGSSLDSAGFARLASFGASNNADRGLGSTHHTFSTADETVFGVRFVNNSGTTLHAFSVTYDGEQWRRAASSSASDQSLKFAFSLTAPSLLSADYVSLPQLDVHSVDDGGTGAGAGLNGNAVAVRGISALITGIEWQPGASLWMRWVDPNDAGVNDHGLAIDNFSVTFEQGASVLAVDPATGGVTDPAP